MIHRKLRHRRVAGCAATALAAAGLAFMPLTLPASAAVDSVSTESRSYFEDAQKRLEAGKVGAAMIQLRNAVQADPQNWQARQMLGQLYLRRGDFQSAEKELSRVHEAQPSPAVAIDLARARGGLGDYEAAFNTLPEAGTSGDQEIMRNLVAADLHLALDRPEMALQAVTRVLAEEPLNVTGNLMMARVELARDAPDSALNHLTTVLDVEPDHLEARLLKSRVLLAQGKIEAAVAETDKAAAAHPNAASAHITAARALLARSRAAEAIARLDKAIAIDENNVEAQYLKAVALAGENRYEEAEALLSSISENVRNYDPALLLTGIVKLQTGQLAQARNNLQAFIARHPDHVQAHRSLAVVHLRDGNPAGAVETLRDIVANQTDPEPALLRLLATAQMRAGDTAAAKTTYAKLAESGSSARASANADALSQLLDDESRTDSNLPSDAFTQLAVGFDQLSLGEYQQALETAKSLATDHPDSPAVQNLLGLTHLALGQEEAARTAFETVLDLDDEWAAAVQQLERLDIRAGRPEDARERAEAYLDRHPDDAGTALRVAQYRWRDGEEKAARQVLADLVARRPESDTARQAHIQFLAQTNQLEAARGAARDFAQARPDDPDLLMQIVQQQGQLGDRDGARTTLERVLTIAPKRLDARLFMGRLERVAGNSEAALTQFRRAVELAPGDFEAHAELASTEANLGNEQAALKTAERLIQESPSEGRRLKARVLETFGKAEEAEQVLRAAFAADPSAGVMHDLYQVRIRAGETEPAMAELEDWIEDRPSDVTGHLLLADLHIRKGHYAKAERILTHASGYGDGNPALLNNLAWLRHQLGDPRAIQAARRAYQLAPNDPRVVDTLGWILFEDGQQEVALPLLREAHRGAPDNAEIRYHLAAALHRTGDTDGARAMLKPALDAPDNFPGRDAAARLLEQIAQK